MGHGSSREDDDDDDSYGEASGSGSSGSGGWGSKPKVKVSRFFIQYSTFNIQSGVLFRVLDGYQPVASYQHHVTYYLSISS
jgi:hypothetical protein